MPDLNKYANEYCQDELEAVMLVNFIRKAHILLQPPDGPGLDQDKINELEEAIIRREHCKEEYLRPVIDGDPLLYLIHRLCNRSENDDEEPDDGGNDASIKKEESKGFI